jgi:ketosteroid isomerase-like protein
MSQENVEVVGRAFEVLQEALRRGDPGAGFDEGVREKIIASNLEWRAGPKGGVGAAGIGDFAGREGFVELMRRWSEDFEDFAIKPEQIIDAANDRVVAITHTYGTGKGSGARVELRSGAIFTLEGRRIVRADFFIDPNNALQAVGLRE